MVSQVLIMSKIVLYHGTSDKIISPTYGLGIQYCIKSKLAYSKLTELHEELTSVDFVEFNEKYNLRDYNARTKMRDLINSDLNKVEKVFSTLL